MRILITGANGQVGHELLRALAEKHKSHPSQPPFVSKGEENHPLPQEGGRAEGAGGCRPYETSGGCVSDAIIIPATRSGECSSPLPSGEGAPQGRVRVRACEVLDLADADGLTKTLDRIAPDVIINAAAYTAVDRAEDEPEFAQRINGDALGVLGAWARQHDARVVHYSTDYVFDGSATRPYRETDATHPVSVYGRTKLAGEIALRDSGARHLIFRTAWVYAARGSNFLRTMLRLGAERDELRVVDDQIGAPTPARLIAEVTAQVIAQWSNDDAPTRDGIYHLVTSGQTSWCGFARAIFERATLFTPFETKGVAPQARGDVEADDKSHPPRRASRAFAFAPPFLRKGEATSTPFRRKGVDVQHWGDARAQRAALIERAPVVHAITTADYPTKAKRPAYSVLDTTKLRGAFGIVPPDWQAALDEVIDELARGR